MTPSMNPRDSQSQQNRQQEQSLHYQERERHDERHQRLEHPDPLQEDDDHRDTAPWREHPPQFQEAPSNRQEQRTRAGPGFSAGREQRQQRGYLASQAGQFRAGEPEEPRSRQWGTADQRGGEESSGSYGIKTGGRASGSQSYGYRSELDPPPATSGDSPEYRRNSQHPPDFSRREDDRHRQDSQMAGRPLRADLESRAGDPEPDLEAEPAHHGTLASSYRRGTDEPAHSSRFDSDYYHWRAEQMKKLNQDYEVWRRERYEKFSEEFDSWRSQRAARDADPKTGMDRINPPQSQQEPASQPEHASSESSLVRGAPPFDEQVSDLPVSPGYPPVNPGPAEHGQTIPFPETRRDVFSSSASHSDQSGKPSASSSKEGGFLSHLLGIGSSKGESRK